MPSLRMASNISTVLLLLAVILSPLPLGSVDGYWVAIWCVLLAASLALVDLRPVSARHVRLVLPTLGALGLFVALVAVQSASIQWVDGLWPDASALVRSSRAPLV